MFRFCISTLFLLKLAATCEWSKFFAGSGNLKCTSDGVTVECAILKDGIKGRVKISCSQGQKVTGYMDYSCIDGNIYPRTFASKCALATSKDCKKPIGKTAKNMMFVKNTTYRYNLLPKKEEFPDLQMYVKCARGFSFKHGVVEDVLARCVQHPNMSSSFDIVTPSAKDGCLPTCSVEDKNELPRNVDNLDRITIVSPSDVAEVSAGSTLYATVMCAYGYSPVNVPVGGAIELECASKGQTTAKSGYLLQKCSGECFSCEENCLAPYIEGGAVYDKQGQKLGKDSKSIPPGTKTAYVKCDEGLSLMGSRYLSCSEGKYSHAVPTCTANKICSPPIVTNGMPSPDKSKFTSTSFVIKCNPGYALAVKSPTTVNCSLSQNSNEAVSTDVPLCLAGCSVPVIKNGGVLEEKQMVDNEVPYASGEKITIVCDDGYLIKDKETMTCGVAGWEGEVQCLTEEELSQLGKVKDSSSSLGIIVSSSLVALLLLLH